jgi:DNA topoisomerase-2
LGTTEKSEIRDIFGKKMTKLVITEKSIDSLEMAFGKGNASDRKQWISRMDPLKNRTDTIDFHKDIWFSQKIEDFVNNDLICFARDDCVRSIPSVFDGFKESQRKIFFAAKKKKFFQPLKVTQFAGYVSENSDYHHGEQNLQDTIIKMAQDFLGSNNCPIFANCSMIGSRLSGGKDAANARYVNTHFRKYINFLFPSEDDAFLNYKKEGSFQIEPSHYLPIVPLILLNGSKGIGTGWSSEIPCFDVIDVIKNTKRWIAKEPLCPMIPQFGTGNQKFKGSIEPKKENSLCDTSVSFEMKGLWTRNENKIFVSELPVGLWTEKFSEWCQEQKDIKDVNNQSSDFDVHFTLTVTSDFDMSKFEHYLTTNLSLSNMVIFDKNLTIRHVNLQEIFDMWGEERCQLYTLRKKMELIELEHKQLELETQILFRKLVAQGKVDLFSPIEVIFEIMTRYKIASKFFETLVNLPIRHFSQENAKSVERSLQKICEKIDHLKQISISAMWLQDIARFEKSFFEKV